jgi:hypothetical protein
MKIHRIKIPGATLFKIPEDDRLFFLGFGHLINELNTLHKLLLWSLEAPATHEIESSAHFSQQLLLSRVLCGKLCEGKKFVQGKGASYAQVVPLEAQQALSNLKKYFSQKNLICNVRNKFSFHYDPKTWRSAIDAIDSKQVPSKRILRPFFKRLRLQFIRRPSQ